MQYIEGIFIKRPYNPVSWAIRLGTPQSITTPSPASHVIAVDGDYGIEANMLHGVRRVPLAEAIGSATVVARVKYEVRDAEAGLAFMRGEALRKAPYDFKGALGLGLAPGRQWQDSADWFCFELFAAGLASAGRALFVDNARISAVTLLTVNPNM
jgi:hypothetical protein